MSGQKGQSVGVVGVGIMGSSVATRLIGTGHQVSVFDLDAAKVAALVAKGARGHLSPRRGRRRLRDHQSQFGGYRGARGVWP